MRGSINPRRNNYRTRARFAHVFAANVSFIARDVYDERGDKDAVMVYPW